MCSYTNVLYLGLKLVYETIKKSSLSFLHVSVASAQIGLTLAPTEKDIVEHEYTLQEQDEEMLLGALCRMILSVLCTSE